MSGDQIISIIMLIVSFIAVYMSFFYIRKDRFLNTDDFAMFRDGLFSPIINFWLIKIFIVFASLFMTYYMVQLVIIQFS